MRLGSVIILQMLGSQKPIIGERSNGEANEEDSVVAESFRDLYLPSVWRTIFTIWRVWQALT